MRSNIEGAWIRDCILQGKTRYGAMEQTLIGNLTLLADTPLLALLNPNGTPRTITLPAVRLGAMQIIANTDSASILTVNNPSAVAIDTIEPGATGTYVSSSTAWRMQVAAGSTSDEPDSKFTLNATVGATAAAAGDMTGAKNVYAGYSAVGAANLTTRTATQIIAEQGLSINESYFLRIINTSGGTTTLVAGTGVTITGTATMATNTYRDFNVKMTAAGAVTFQNLGSGAV